MLARRLAATFLAALARSVNRPGRISHPAAAPAQNRDEPSQGDQHDERHGNEHNDQDGRRHHRHKPEAYVEEGDNSVLDYRGPTMLTHGLDLRLLFAYDGRP
jgi:hypothetical protein